MLGKKNKGPNPFTTILVVTPAFNSAEFLDDTIVSVVSQSGAFHLRYHIQDGGSTDATMAIVRRWDRLLRTGDFPILCAGLTFSSDSRPDAGMYQAINRGVELARPDQPFVMGWINSDDRLAPGALAAIAGVYEQFADVHFTCARVSLIDRNGVITGINLPASYDRQMLSEGSHDGRSQSFVMQEGTFWRSGLWDRVGGLDERFRLAGDWDLWRRFARHAALFTVDSVLGFHRRHAGQLSADMRRYHAEIDAAERLAGVATRLDDAGCVGGTLRFELDSHRWNRSQRPAAGARPPIVHHERKGALVTRRIEVTHGARHAEGPYPEVHLPAGMRWIDDANAAASVIVPFPGRWQMHLRIRNWRPDLRLRVWRGATISLAVMPGAGEDNCDTLLSASLWLEGGRNELRIESAAKLGAVPGWMFILLEWYVLAPAKGAAPLLHRTECDKNAVQRSAPSVSVVLRTSTGGWPLDRMIDAVLDQAYPDVEICVIHEASCKVDQQILAAYASVLDHVIVAEEPSSGAAFDRAVSLCHGALIAVLDNDAVLAPAALARLGEAYGQRDGANFFAGITAETADLLLTMRHLPMLPDGPLSMPDLLHVAACHGGSKVLDRGGLFFTRGLWHAGGTGVALATPDSPLGVWAHWAAAGAVLRMLPVDLIRRRTICDRTTAPTAADDLLLQAAALAAECGLPPVRAMAMRTRPALKIVMLDSEPVADRPSANCKRLAAALAAAGQRVVCLIDEDGADPATAASMLEVIASEHPDLVVLVGDSPAGSCKFVPQLVTRGLLTLETRECQPPSERQEATRRFESGAAADLHEVLIYQGAPDAGEPQTAAAGLRPGVDLTLYCPDRRRQARLVLGLPPDAFIVLAIANSVDLVPSRLIALAEAHAHLDCPGKLLIVLGSCSALLQRDYAVVPMHDSGAEDVHALYFAAANVVVPVAHGNVIVPLLQAAASGTPVIADGCAQDDGGIRQTPFGLRLPTWTPGLLREALDQLRSDHALCRKISRSAVAYVRAHHSLEASAWSFMTQVATLRGCERLRLAPELCFPATSRYVTLRGLQSGRTRPLLVPRWQPAVGFSPWHDPATVAGGTAIDLGAMDLFGGAATFYLRAPHGGPQPLHIRAAGHRHAAFVIVRINGEELGRLRIAPRDNGYEVHVLLAPLFRGLNRIELAHAPEADTPSTRLTLRSLDLGDEPAEVDEEPFRRLWQPLTGFAEVEQIDGDDAPTRWIDESAASLRFWSDVSALQRVCLFLKNYDEPQAVDFAVNDIRLGKVNAQTTDFYTSTRFMAEVMVERGWNLLWLNVHGLADRPQFGRNLLMVVAGVYVAAIDDMAYLEGYEYRTSVAPCP